MSARAGSSIGTFLMSMPVSAMLLMGVFGVPRFAPGTGGESGWQNAKQFLTSLASQPGEGPPVRPQFPGVPGSSTADSMATEAPQWGSPAPAPHSNASAAEWPFSDQRDLSSRSSATSAGFDAHPLVSRSTPAATAPASITWQDARRRLADLGIDQFHLEPGLESDQYLFVCLLTPGTDERVTQRFEAEAGEPLAAVQAVLTQIDDWLAQQYAQDNRAPAPFGRR